MKSIVAQAALLLAVFAPAVLGQDDEGPEIILNAGGEDEFVHEQILGCDNFLDDDDQPLTIQTTTIYGQNLAPNLICTFYADADCTGGSFTLANGDNDALGIGLGDPELAITSVDCRDGTGDADVADFIEDAENAEGADETTDDTATDDIAADDTAAADAGAEDDAVVTRKRWYYYKTMPATGPSKPETG